MGISMFRKKQQPRNELHSELKHIVHRSEIGRGRPINPERLKAISDAKQTMEKIDLKREKIKKRYGI